MLSKIQTSILGILSAALIEKEYSVEAAEMNYDELFRECEEQGILSLALEHVLSACSDKNIKNALYVKFARQECAAINILAAQDEVLELLKSKGFHPVILKGWAAAQYYLAPEKRTFGDIDVLLQKEEFYPGLEFMMNSGYNHRDRNVSVDHHIPLKKGGIVVEPHCRRRIARKKGLTIGRFNHRG